MFGTIGRGTALDPLLGQPGAQFDGTKFNWIGSANDEVSVCVAWHTSGFSTFDDVLRRELLIGGTGPGDDTIQFGKVLRADGPASQRASSSVGAHKTVTATMAWGSSWAEAKG